jgi:hypothetical protein
LAGSIDWFNWLVQLVGLTGLVQLVGLTLNLLVHLGCLNTPFHYHGIFVVWVFLWFTLLVQLAGSSYWFNLLVQLAGSTR